MPGISTECSQHILLWRDKKNMSGCPNYLDMIYMESCVRICQFFPMHGLLTRMVLFLLSGSMNFIGQKLLSHQIRTPFTKTHEVSSIFFFAFLFFLFIYYIFFWSFFFCFFFSYLEICKIMYFFNLKYPQIMYFYLKSVLKIIHCNSKYKLVETCFQLII